MLLDLEKYHRPKSISEAIDLLMNGVRSIAPIAGGTYIVPSNDRSITELVDITNLGLDYITNDKDHVVIGATATIQQVVDSKSVAAIAGGVIVEAAKATTVSKMIRNVSTVGGELAQASPHSSLALVLLILDARLKIVGKKEYQLPIREFFVGDKRASLNGELITEVQVPKPLPNTGTSLLRLAMIPSSPSIINVASLLSIDAGICRKARIAVAAGTASIVRMMQAEKMLAGKEIDDRLIEASSQKVADLVEPIGDARASAEYRRDMSAVLTRRSLQESFEKAIG